MPHGMYNTKSDSYKLQPTNRSISDIILNDDKPALLPSSRKGNIVVGSPSLNQLLIQTLLTTTKEEKLGKIGATPVFEGQISRNKSHITSTERCGWILSDLDFQISFEDLKCCSTRKRPLWDSDIFWCSAD